MYFFIHYHVWFCFIQQLTSVLTAYSYMRVHVRAFTCLSIDMCVEIITAGSQSAVWSVFVDPLSTSSTFTTASAWVTPKKWRHVHWIFHRFASFRDFLCDCTRVFGVNSPLLFVICFQVKWTQLLTVITVGDPDETSREHTENHSLCVVGVKGQRSGLIYTAVWLLTPW